jgi:hypothetical protein
MTRIMELLDQALGQAATATRPDDALNCALSEYSCDGWFTPRYASIIMTDGTRLGLCPKAQRHLQIAAGNPEAARVRGALTGAFNAQNPDYVVGSGAKTKILRQKAVKA